MSVRPLIGEPLALDLVNTQWSEHGELMDYLADPDGLQAWLAEHAEELGSTQQNTLDPLRQTRQAIRTALEHQEYADLDEVLGHGRIRLGFEQEVVELDDPSWRPAWNSARAFLELVRTAPAGRIRNCDGPGCVLWFLDTSRNGRRRWCSMTGCGNRAKARTHYSRAHVHP